MVKSPPKSGDGFKTPKSRHVDNKRDVLLDAAERVAIRLGAAHLTLDAVAKEAKVGKGGLIYHFPSKKSLFQAMLIRAIDIYQSDQTTLINPSNRSDFTQARIRQIASVGKRLEQLANIVISIAVNYPELLKPLRKQCVALYEKLAHDKIASRAVIAMLAVHGLFLMERLGLGPLEEKRRAQLIQALHHLVQEGQQPSDADF